MILKNKNVLKALKMFLYMPVGFVSAILLKNPDCVVKTRGQERITAPADTGRELDYHRADTQRQTTILA